MPMRSSRVATMALMIAVLLPAAPATALDRSPVLLQGRVVNGLGQPIQWATVRVNASLGGAVEPTIASTVTNRSGLFEVRSGYTPRLKRAAATNDGYVNLSVEVSDGTYELSYGVSRAFKADAPTSTASGGWVDRNSGEPRRSRLLIHLARGRAGVTSLPRKVRMRMGAGTGPHSPNVCGGATWVHTSDPAYDALSVVGEFHMWGDTWGYFKYGAAQSTDSDIGIAVSADGNGPWSISGTNHIGVSTTSSNEAEWDRTGPYGHKLLSEFRYRKWKYVTGCGVVLKYRIRAEDWNTGASQGADISGPDGQCTTTYDANKVSWTYNTKWTTSDAVAKTWARGVSITAFGGSADISLRSGYSTHVVGHWEFGGARARHYICGVDAKPPQASRVFAGPNT